MSLADRPHAGALLVPYVVDEKRTPVDFKALNLGHVDRCAKEQRCGVCGGKIRAKRVALIGPDDGRSCFADPWMHLDCARLAMAQCPFLAGRRGWRDEAGDDHLVATYERNMVLFTARRWRSHRDRRGAWHFEALAGLERA